MSNRPKVFVIDDEADLRKALSRLLLAEGIDVETFGSAGEFLDRLADDATGCVVLDVAMPGLDGLELQHRLGQRKAALPIVFLTGRGDIPMSVRAIKAGAIDFLTKPVKRAELLHAVQLAFTQVEAERVQLQANAELCARLARLTPREREVLEHVISGKLNKVIAARLGTTEQTIKVHRGRVMEKLGVGSVAELVRIAERLDVSPAP